jgi:hypothetical protein
LRILQFPPPFTTIHFSALRRLSLSLDLVVLNKCATDLVEPTKGIMTVRCVWVITGAWVQPHTLPSSLTQCSSNHCPAASHCNPEARSGSTYTVRLLTAMRKSFGRSGRRDRPSFQELEPHRLGLLAEFWVLWLTISFNEEDI